MRGELLARYDEPDMPSDPTLHEIQDRLRRAQELGGAFPYEWNARTETLLAPAAMGRLYGLTSEEKMSYETLVARIHPDDREAAKLGHRKALDEGGHYEQEYRVVLDDGDVRWLLVRGEATRDANDRPMGLAGVVMEITDRKQIELRLIQRERELAESNRFIRNVLSSSNDCIKVLDLDANLRFMSEGGMRVMEVDDFSRIEGCSWPTFWNGEAGEQARAAIAAAKAGGSGNFQGMSATLQGNQRWWDVSVTPIQDEDGITKSLLSISRDITERKLAEDALRRSQERLELALSAGKIGTWVWDIQQGTITADERLANIFGIEPTVAAAGAPVETYLTRVHPDDRERAIEIMESVTKHGGDHEVELRLLKEDGSTMWVVARGECQLDPEGRPIRFPAATVDITPQKQSELARELLTRELAHRIKNIFSVINGLISLSARNNPEARPFAASLRERIIALAHAHDFVPTQGTEGSIAGRDENTAFSLIKMLLAPYLQEGRERVIVTGDDVLLGSKSATAMALVIHEQATNAMKYGGLSSVGGTVQLRCTRTEDTYSMVWQEAGGPEITTVPERRGFGSELASLSVEGQLGGTLSYDWNSAGLVVHVSIPLQKLSN